LLFSRGQNAQDGNHDEIEYQVTLDIPVLWHINLCSNRLMPSHTAASISPRVFIVTSHVSCPAVDALPGRDGDSATPETFACRLLARQDDTESTYLSKNLATAGEAMSYNIVVSGAAAHHAAGPTAVFG
jgi:hypothetical protein